MIWFKKKRIQRAVKKFYKMYGEKSEHNFKIGFHEKIFNKASDALMLAFDLERSEANKYLHDFNKKMTMELLDEAFSNLIITIAMLLNLIGFIFLGWVVTRNK